MLPTVVTHRLFMFDTVMHQRPIQHDIDQREGADADSYPAFTEVAFSEFQVVTRVDTAMDSPDVNVNEVDQLFPRAPHRLKKLVRNNSACIYHCFLRDDCFIDTMRLVLKDCVSFMQVQGNMLRCLTNY